MFEKIQGDWREAKFEVSPCKEDLDYYFISSTEDVTELLEDSLVQLGNISGARFVDKIRGDVEKFLRKL